MTTIQRVLSRVEQTAETYPIAGKAELAKVRVKGLKNAAMDLDAGFTWAAAHVILMYLSEASLNTRTPVIRMKVKVLGALVFAGGFAHDQGSPCVHVVVGPLDRHALESAWISDASLYA